ncbi:hypothetical protein K450DRAFT_236231 [Umbelopsis ramanniana AG]|uniref:Trichome birefringence-like C-terminal domain-containing protein n=1 Tax=Umbelopsis ramanniana AG TaxID=1314678 RepID=A0AAD5ECA0_UMBRA|nr:uncharacterized protein K450DRAFT_236231 [Umbelopsis ramanniana AG]KAI8580564.1 hypothetical protein K450DRAFT_236231 [Umbelopsis ramanniana AG]
MLLSFLTPRHIILLLSSLTVFLWIIWSGRVSDLQTSITNYVRPEEEETSLIINNNAVDPSQLCTPAMFNDGQWVATHLLDPYNATVEDVQRVGQYTCKEGFQHKCYMRPGKEFLRSAKMVNYKWQPNCHLLNFHSHLFSSQLLANPMLFVGDSITELQFESLKCLLGEHFDTAKRIKNTKHHTKTLGLQNKTAVEYIRSDYLLRLDTWKVQQEGEEPGPLLGIGYNVPWSVIYEPRQDHLISEIATNKNYGYSIVGCICFPDIVIL